MKVLAFAGSLRAGSYNRKLVAIAAEHLRAHDEHGKPTAGGAPTWKQLDNARAMLLDVAAKLG